MSNPDLTPTDPKPEPTLIQQDGAVPETIVPESAQDPVPEPELPLDAGPSEPKAEEAKPAKKDQKVPLWRVQQVTAQKGEIERKLAEKDAELKILREAQQKREQDNQPQNGLTKEEFERQVKAEAQRVVQAQAYETRAKSWLDKGTKEYGAADFNAKCDMVAALGAADRPEFMATILDPEVLPDGHKIVGRLADEPEEAQRILSLPPQAMIAALVRYSMTEPKPEKSLSNAPRPIKPIGATAKEGALSDTDDMKTWMAKRQAEVAAKKARR